MLVPLLIYLGVAVIVAAVMLARGWAWTQLWRALFWLFYGGRARGDVWRDIWMRNYKP